MNAQVIAFPGDNQTQPSGPISRPRRQYRFRDMVHLLKLGALSRRTQIDHLRRLAAQRGLPLPKNPRIYAGAVQDGANAIGSGSVWCALEVDAWFEGPRIARKTAPDTPPVPAAARAVLAARARQLAAGL